MCLWSESRTLLRVPTDAGGPGLAAVVQEAHVCQTISVVHTAASLQDLCGEKRCMVSLRGATLTEQNVKK